MAFLGLTPDQWLQVGISAGMILAALTLGGWIVSFVLGRVVRGLTRRTTTSLDDQLLKAVRGPLYWLAVIIVTEIALARLDFLPDQWDDTSGPVFFVLYLFTGSTLAWRVVAAILEWYGDEMTARTDATVSAQLVPFLRRAAMVLLGAIVLITLLGRFDVDVSALVTTLGIGSLAIALAAQAALEDMVSGFVVMVDRPYRIGDRVEILDLETWGDVVDIGLRSTRIRTRDNRTVIVPNSVMGKSLIVNHAYPDTVYRLQVHIGVAYGTDLELARETMVEAVRGVEGVITGDPEKPVEALFVEFGDSALVFRVRWWIEDYVDTRRMFDRVNTRIYNALNAAGVAIPFPQRDVWHRLDAADAASIRGLLNSLGGGGPDRAD